MVLAKRCATINGSALRLVLRMFCPASEVVKYCGATGRWNTHARVTFGVAALKPLDLRHGWKEGCILALRLFAFYFACVLCDMSCNNLISGIQAHFHTDCELFCLCRSDASTMCRDVYICVCMYLYIYSHTY